ncbi:MAG: protein BatD [Alistipes sp.]|nr:protein BatD [Alistipes sp.]
MKTLLKILIAVCATALGIGSARADEKVTFETNAPMLVSAGEAFRIEFALNAKPDDNSFVPPSFDGFDVLAGPAVSQGSSIRIINGEMSKSINYTITYVLLPQKSGDFRIGAAEAKVKDKTYRTRETIVEVRDNSSGDTSGAGQSANRQQDDDNASLESKAGNQIGKDDLMLRLTLSRRNVYKGEPIRATLKLYSRVNVVGSEGAKMPTFNGFWSQELETEQGPFRETVGGKVYEAYNIAEYLLYPQQNGTLRIEPSELTVVVQVVLQSNRGFDPFFGGGHEIYNLRRKLVTPEVTVSVKDFPAGAPASFTGAVGKYTMEAKLSTDRLEANSAATATVKISGTGNLNFLQAPKLELPTSFELYDVKSDESLRTNGSGNTGYRRFEYPFIARAEGDYTIPPIEFAYFNPETEKYVTLSSQAFRIAITPDRNGGGASQGVTTVAKKEDVRLLGNDIRFIKLGNPALRSHVTPLVLSPLYFIVAAAILILFAAVYAAMRKHIRDSRNTALVKGRRANKVAVQRFRTAAKYMKEQNRHAFYEEMLRALWGYLSDRFNIPVADLTKESVREELARRGAHDEARLITEIISECEEAQYSPSASVRMDEVYAEGIDIISRIESAIKR